VSLRTTSQLRWDVVKKKSHESPRNTAETAFKEVLGISQKEASQFMGNVESTKLLNDNSPNVYVIKLKPNANKEVFNVLSSSKPKSNNYRLRNNISKITRTKKAILGTIAHKLNENKPTSACVPRYGQKAVMFYQTDTPKSRVKMSYHEALSAFVYLLDYADKKAAYESLSEEQPCDLMLMLLF
jgi:hypothetical protein